ncbi:MAG TPA: 4-(cytidine 5'-diphospho)-2-C-methyl-D-erythritol kinase [Gemmatimonadaceae bacterium]|nr:4-(cytidine 5'-diphospho)-2-C-methyl-D-erythritol kinase [Gemmatimonadaceae bacterium]
MTTTPGGVRLAAQAKLNLFLRVLSRERSGFHSLETVFIRLELADTLVLRTGGAARVLHCDGPALPRAGLGPVESNLAFRAAEAYAAATGWPAGFEIHLDKHIPTGGGLGGGSADAGAVLRALNALAPMPLDTSMLLRIAASLGADVPFCTAAVPLALAWGRGERMLALPPLPSRPVTLLVPPFGVSTRDAFEWMAGARPADGPRPQLLEREALQSWDGVGSLASNDLEDVVTAHHPQLAVLLAALRRTYANEIVGMTGSGSTLFVIGRHVGDLGEEFRDVTRVHTATATRVVGVERTE